jgi:hypothetical protein
MTCPWFKLYREHLSDGSCSLYPSDETHNLVHVHHDAQYSTDPETGRPLALTLDNLDPCELSKFSLNRRICSVSTEVERSEIHIAAFEPRTAVEFWTIVQLVIDKWDRFHEKVGYWPSVCTVTDAVIDPELLRSNTDGEEGSVRSLRPIHFVKDCTSFAAAINKLLVVWFRNYYLYVLDVTDEDELQEILSCGGLSETSCAVKARRIECDAKDHALGFWERYDPDKYKEMFSGDSKTDMSSWRCCLKYIMDKTSFARLQRESRKRSAGSLKNVKQSEEKFYYDKDNDNVVGDGGGGGSDDYDYDDDDDDDDDDDNMSDRPKSLLTSERLRSKRLFHAIVVNTFGNHRDYPHTIMCKDFIVNNKRWCSMWLETLRKFCDYRLCRLKQNIADDEEEEARTGIRQTMKDWNALFPTLTESIKQREREMYKMLRKKKKNDSIARDFATHGLAIKP